MGHPAAIMFHSVGLDRWPWRSAYVSEPIRYFERKMEAISRAGFETVFFASPAGTGKNARRRVALTFDDGYLDNWVHVLPMLERFGLKATVFMTADFVDPRPVMRPRVAFGSVNEDEHDPGGCCAGFLSWPEMREMEKTGLVDIQAHALTHTWYFKGPKVVDFWRPGSATETGGPVWMLWNRFPEFKPFYLTQAGDYEKKIPYGTPIYEHGKSLATRRFDPVNGLDHVLVEHVDANGGEAFFESPTWRDELERIVSSHQERTTSSEGGQRETQEAYHERIRHELSESKRILESNLNKQITAVCWPGGGVSEEVLAIARDVGYTRFTLPSAWEAAQTAGSYADLTPRIGSVVRGNCRGRDLGVITPREFAWRVGAQGGSIWYDQLVKASKGVRLVRAILKGR